MLDLRGKPAGTVFTACVLSGMMGLAGVAASGRQTSPAPDGRPGSEDATAVAAWTELLAPADAGARLDATGSFLVTLAEGAIPGLFELWSEPSSGGEAARLSGPMAPGDRVAAFVVSPDGLRVAFTASRAGGPLRLFEVSIVGGLPLRIDSDPARGSVPSEVGGFAFRPDSRALVFVRQRFGDGASEPDRAPTVVLLDLIFTDGFESGEPSAWSDTTPNACPTPTGGPTYHANSVLQDEQWWANDSPHILTGNVLIPAGIQVSVQQCAELRIRPGVGLEVRGAFVGYGAALQRITIHRDDPAQPFGSILARSPGVAYLDFTDIVGGGSADAALLLQGLGSSPGNTSWFTHVKVIGSAGLGVRLYNHAEIYSGSHDLVVTGSGSYPVVLGETAVGSLPTGSYMGNAIDVIQVLAGAAVAADLAIHDRGVPYQIGGGGSFGILSVTGNPSLATLTIDPGVEIRFSSAAGGNYGGLNVNTLGRLVAVGTPDAPILFTGAGVAPPAGYWEGITFRGELAADNLLDHVQIEAAGAHGGDQGFGCPPQPDGNQTDGALKLFTQPGAQILTHSTISNSISHGVFRAWTGGLVDFLPTNSFVNVALCQQVLPHPPAPEICPENPDCPM